MARKFWAGPLSFWKRAYSHNVKIKYQILAVWDHKQKCLVFFTDYTTSTCYIPLRKECFVYFQQQVFNNMHFLFELLS